MASAASAYLRRARRDRHLAQLALSRASLPPQNPLVNGQPVWAIDPQNPAASDRNPGTLAAPLRTAVELERRIGPGWLGLAGRVDVYLRSPFPAGSPLWTINVDTTNLAGTVWIHGGYAVARAGMLSAATPLNRAGDLPMTITDSIGQAWAPFVGTSYVRITSGASTGAVAELRKDLGAGRVQLGELLIPDPLGSPNPIFALAGNESYELLTPISVPPLDIFADGPRIRTAPTDPFPVIVQDCEIQDATIGSVTSGPGVVCMSQCTIGSASYEADVTLHQQVIMRSGSVQLVEGGGTLSEYGGMAFACIVAVNDGRLEASRDWGPQAGAFVFVSPLNYFEFTEMSAFDSDVPFTVFPGATMQGLAGSVTHTLWGTGNTTTGVQVGAGGQFVVSSIVTLVLTGGGGGWSDFMLDSLHATPYVRADDGTFVAVPLACSWVNFRTANAANGFGGNATEPVSQARVVQSLAF